MLDKRAEETAMAMATKTVKLDTRSEGQAFGCVGIVRDARTGRKLAETRVYPYGFTGPAMDGAEAIAKERGWTVVSAEAD